MKKMAMKNHEEPVVSVVVPCYNHGQFIKGAIDSIITQSLTDWEIIVVDDGSTDAFTKKTLESLNEDYDSTRISVLTQANGGVGSARNTGIEQAKGKYIVCLDADDEISPLYLEKCVAEFEKDKTGKLGIVTSWLREFGLRSDIWKPNPKEISEILETNVFNVASMFKRSAWKELGGYSENRKLQAYADWEFWLKHIEKNYTWSIVELPLFRYRIREDSMLRADPSSHGTMFKIIYDLHKDLYQKHAKELIFKNVSKLRELHLSIQEKDESIKEYKQASEFYQGQFAREEDKYNSLVRSRIIVIAMKFVDISISLRKFLPSLKGRTRHFIVRHIPGPIWRILRRLRIIVLSVKTIKVPNETWPKNTPLVTIVSPFYNQGAFIQETVDSILAQTYQDFEYIIVNDGSDEQNSKALDVFKDDRITIVTNPENMGKGSPAAARNKGVSMAKGKYVICLDSDDTLDPTYIEKALIVAESDPNVSLVSSDTQTFGASDEIMRYVDYDAQNLINNNMVTTAALFKKDAWTATKGYKTDIGYEDWEQWIHMAELGYFGRRIPETLFHYRTAAQSRYIDDKKKHQVTMGAIRSLHGNYHNLVKTIQKQNRRKILISDSQTALLNLQNQKTYLQPRNSHPNVMLAVPWLTFGGAETLILNFCKEIGHSFNLSIVTGLQSDHEWEHKFKDLTTSIYHLANLFNDKKLYLEFMSNYITTRDIDILHIIHTDFVFNFLPELKRRHPKLKVIVTMFNDRVEHFEKSVDAEKHVDKFTSDNHKVGQHYIDLIGDSDRVVIIPNGIDCVTNFNPALFNREEERSRLNLEIDDIAVFFVGRISPEKNPDVFLKAAKEVTDKSSAVKFFVIGDGPIKPMVEDMVESIGKDSVRYLGYQSEIARYLSSADIFVLPSSIEGFPLSILEAMAMRLAIISSDVGAVAEVLDNGADGIIVTPGVVSEITDAVLLLEHDRPYMEQIKDRAQKKLLGTYSNKKLGDNYMKLYKGLL